MQKHLGKPNESFPSIFHKFDDFIKFVKNWWNVISHGRPSISLTNVAKFLQEKGLASSFNKSILICKEFVSDEIVDLAIFENIFLKSILHAQLVNVQYGIGLQENNGTLRMKMALMQRKLLIMGVDPEETGKERGSLSAIFEYSANSKKKKKDKDKIKKGTVKEAEDLNRHKIEEIIYNSDHKAAQFISKNGNIKSEITTTWGAKRAIGDKEDSPIFHKKNYIKALNLQNSPKAKEPYSANIRLFRENFLFKKFHKVSTNFPVSYGLT